MVIAFKFLSPATSLLQQETQIAAQVFAEQWAKRIDTYADAYEMFTPLFISELMIDGETTTTKIREADRDIMARALVRRWERQKRCTIFLDAWKKSIAYIRREAHNVGMDLSYDDAEKLIIFNLRERKDLEV